MNTMTKEKIKDTVEEIANVIFILSPTMSAIGGIMIYDGIKNRRQRNIARDIKRLRKIAESDLFTVKK